MQVRYPFMTLNDDTEITYSSPIQNGDSIQVRVDMKTPIGNGFKSASCILPGYQWRNNGYIVLYQNFVDLARLLAVPPT